MSVDFALSDAQRELQQAGRALGRDVLSGVAEAISGLPTPEQRFDAIRPFYEQLVGAGLLRALVEPPAPGGPGFVGMALLVEEMMAVDVNVPLTLLSNGLAVDPVLHFGTPQQIERLLAPLRQTTGAPLAGFAFSEVEGSANWNDPHPDAGLRTVAQADGDAWVISGFKQYTTNGYGWNGRGADLYTVVCRTDLSRPAAETLTVIAVEGGAPGIVIEGSRDTSGHLAAVSPRIRFDGVRVPRENMIGAPGDGVEIVETAFNTTAALVGAMCVGVMRAAFDVALRFAREERRAGSVPIVDHQAIGFLLADMKIRIEAVRSLMWRAALAAQRSDGRDSELAVASKVFASETAVQVVWDAMRVVGVEAYSHHLPLAGLLNDVIAYPLFDGSNMGVRRRQLHDLMRADDYDPLATLDIPQGAAG